MLKSITAIHPVVITTCEKTGLITSTQITLPTLFKGVDKKSVDVSKGLKAVLPESIGDSERVTFKMFHNSIDTSIAGIGGRATFTSFVQCLGALACASAYGQNLNNHYERLPAFAEYALKLAQGYIGKTESLVLSKLVDVVDKVIGEIFALPIAPTKGTKKPPVNAPAPIPAPIADDNNVGPHGFAKFRSLAAGHEAHEDSIRASDTALIFAPELELAIAREKARIAAQALADAEKADVNFIASFEAIAKNRPDFAIEQLKAMAELAGFKLVKKPAKKAA